MTVHEHALACRRNLGEALESAEDGDVLRARSAVDQLRAHVNAILEVTCRAAA